MSETEIAERFKRETATHVMEIKHDDGLYRHLRFKSPKHGRYWFDLITVPHALIFRGDGESFVFSRTDDMFEFFRSGLWSDGSLHIDAVYWAEKLTSDRDSVMKYSKELFDQQVAEELKEAEADWPGVTKAWDETVNDFFASYNTEYEHDARAAVDAFEFWLGDDTEEPFRFQDTGEWEFKDYHWWFLWALHGIVWGISQYDQARAAAPQGGEQ
ncbi:hypothetical protein OG884_06225 [Streptosporangium sp. NBC_01755]|uniref:hypothetical protein n=1 Tax=Streptosporangium sp. NBC_01755 TaxID=2975949 RepID=UPI002DD9D75C|nr:hypothetical protein [Streptosporangium sp. NBC_01755]WSD01524.1 hypothetical protein OG884_06225 [Streptosporangium sp. NBC_01755]